MRRAERRPRRICDIGCTGVERALPAAPMMWSEYNRFVRVCPLLERLDELLSVAREHATQSIKAFVHLPKERSPALAPGP